jgi:hypothetical protein
LSAKGQAWADIVRWSAYVLRRACCVRICGGCPYFSGRLCVFTLFRTRRCWRCSLLHLAIIPDMSTPNCKRPLNDEDYKGLHAATSFLVEVSRTSGLHWRSLIDFDLLLWISTQQDVCIHLCLSIQFVSNQTICGMRVGSSGYKRFVDPLLQS